MMALIARGGDDKQGEHGHDASDRAAAAGRAAAKRVTSPSTGARKRSGRAKAARMLLCDRFGYMTMSAAPPRARMR